MKQPEKEIRRITIRVDSKFYDELAASAKESVRSLHGEIIVLLKEALEARKDNYKNKKSGKEE